VTNQFVAFMDERHGLGAWVAEQIAADLFRNPVEGQSPAGQAGRKASAAKGHDDRPIASADLSMSLFASGSRRSFSGEKGAPQGAAPGQRPRQRFKTWTSPRTSAEATAAAVVSGQAEVGVLPLYEEQKGFNRDTLAALLDFPQSVLGEYVAESNYVLAVPTVLIHEVDQAGFTDSFDASGAKSFQWNGEKQRKYRGRVGTVYASEDALRHCAPAIDGMRAKGIDVQLVPDGVDVFREGLSRAAQILDPDREVQTRFGPDGQQRVSKTRGANHLKPLIGVLLSFDRALGDGGYSFDSEYTVLEAEMAGADRVRTSFLATTRRPATDGRDGGIDTMAAVRSLFRAGAGAPHGGEEGALRAMSGLQGRAPGPRRGGEAYPFARVLYAVPTIGRGAKDPSGIYKALADNRLSYRTETLENREGAPLVVAIDVPQGCESRLGPVLRSLRRHPGARTIAVFPSVTPMVHDSVMARPSGMPKVGNVMKGAAVIAAALAGYAIYALAGGA
jgi:hypothetical protein